MNEEQKTEKKNKLRTCGVKLNNFDDNRVQRSICIYFLILGFVLTGCSNHISEDLQENKASISMIKENPLFQKAYAGDPDAQFQIGKIYYSGKGIQYDGKGIPYDYPKAIEYLTKSAKQGHAQAQNDLALMYLDGQGVLKDPQEAAKWLSLAAEQNLPDAQYHLSVLYCYGQIVPKDEDIAFDLLSKSAQAGYVQAQYDLGRYYICARNFHFRSNNFLDMFEAIRTVHENVLPNLNERDIELGFSWLEKAKEQGSQEAAKTLEQLSFLRFVDFETGKLDINDFLSSQIDEETKKKLSETFDK